ncbi:MAG TPA: prenyltransferase/squalene oxidase repeat-containing protein, partial [Nitrococcus sp.]|nr:prenyltransferase/squalene oxidase repeat-containing protein [Nitrococcus sp.]
RKEMARDSLGLAAHDPDIATVIEAVAEWLACAQDHSASADGGVAHSYSLLTGWASSYPETTGYIVPTFIRLAREQRWLGHLTRARRMLDWLVSIQMRDGGFQGGKIDAQPRVPVTFNTGQILIGLAAGATEFGLDQYGESMHRAAQFLRDSLDPDGCWRKHPTPFAAPGEKAYETHVAWGLFEAERLAPNQGYAAAARRQIAWALTKQKPNGWVADCCLTNSSAPLTHTLGYYLKGLVEAHRFSGEPELLDAACRTADGLLRAQRPDGSLPGRLRADWSAAVNWSCLTGNVQIAESWLYLFGVTGQEQYAQVARRANAFVRRTVRLDEESEPEIRGGIKGSFPIDGDYGRLAYLNWAAKFTIDANLAERDLNRAAEVQSSAKTG